MTSPDTATYTVPVVGSAQMKLLALLLADPNPIHYDPAAPARLGLGDRLVSQGPATIAAVYSLFAEHAPGRRVADLDVRLLGNVLEGDRVTVTATPRDERADDYDIEVSTDSGPVLTGRARLADEESEAR